MILRVLIYDNVSQTSGFVYDAGSMELSDRMEQAFRRAMNIMTTLNPYEYEVQCNSKIRVVLDDHDVSTFPFSSSSTTPSPVSTIAEFMHVLDQARLNGKLIICEHMRKTHIASIDSMDFMNVVNPHENLTQIALAYMYPDLWDVHHS